MKAQRRSDQSMHETLLQADNPLPQHISILPDPLSTGFTGRSGLLHFLS